MSEIEFDKKGELKKFANNLSRAAKNMNDMQPLFGMIETRFINEMAELFATEGGTVGGWTPLTEKYALWKGSRQIGVLTGALESSLTGGEGFEAKITKSGAEFGIKGSLLQKAEYFTRKFTRVDGVYVDRPIAISDKALRSWAQLAEDYMAAVAMAPFDVAPLMPEQATRSFDGVERHVSREMTLQFRDHMGRFAAAGARARVAVTKRDAKGRFMGDNK